METIGVSAVHTFLDGEADTKRSKNSAIRAGLGHAVSSYMELAQKVARLQFMNNEHVLLFRGQNADYKNKKGNSSLKPTILRPKEGANPSPDELARRFFRLTRAESTLVAAYEGFGKDRVRRHRIVRWSILQHYGVVDTPLLDVTHSLRIAASFASYKCEAEAYLFVLGVPQLGGAITASADAGVQIVRLASMCPPTAVRPHIQEGYLLGEYPELGDYDQKRLFAPHEVDFGRRVIAKFRFNPKTFWKQSRGFPLVAQNALCPTPESDPFQLVASEIKRSLGPNR